MSGPKSYGASVSDAAYQARMRAQRARAELIAARSAWEALRREAEALAASGVEVSALRPLEDVRAGEDDGAAAARIRRRTEDDRTRLMAEATALKLNVTVGEVQSAAEAMASFEPEVETIEAGGPAETESAAAVSRQVEEKIAGLLEDLDPGAEPTEAMQGLVDTARNEANGADRRRMAAEALREEINRANRIAAARAEIREIAGRIHEQLAGISNPAADEIRSRLEDEGSLGMEAARELEARASELQREARSQWEAEYVGESLAEVLEELGYEVDQGFDTALAGEGYADFGRSEWQGYAVRARRTRNGDLRLNVIRGSQDRSDQAARDAEVEREWCGDVPEVEEKMKVRGVTLDRRSAREPGEVAMQVVPELDRASDRRHREETEREAR